ncbi:MAG TPA: hypothetical protein VHE53_00150 [Patescibacteria group bacterium]|nr:hypothetical protein [Patescibacteria group bacterium]
MSEFERNTNLIPPPVDKRSKKGELVGAIGLIVPYTTFVTYTALEMSLGGSIEQALIKMGIASAIEATAQIAYAGGLKYLHRHKELTELEVAQKHVDLFEKRFGQMKTIDNSPKIARTHSTKLGIDKDRYGRLTKLTEAVVVGRQQGNQITQFDLLIADLEYSGLHVTHEKVYDSNETIDFRKNLTLHGAVFQDENGKRGIILAAEYLIHDAPDQAAKVVDLLTNMLDRYKVDQGFIGYETRSIGNMSDRFVITTNQSYGNMVRDRQIHEFAQKTGMTNSELMRFRLSGQLPSEFKDEDR